MTHIYFNPLDCACKTVCGALKAGETLTLNLFRLRNDGQHPLCQSSNYTGLDCLRTPKECDCTQPNENAVLQLNKDGEYAQNYPMTITPFGWTVSLRINEIGLYFYTFYIDGVGFVSCGHMCFCQRLF